MRPLRALGIAAGIVPWLFISASILLTPWFNPFNDALSDLGNTVLNYPVAYVFDVGLIISGLMAATFGAVLSARNPTAKFLCWSVPLTLGSADLSLIGAFNESMGGIHYIVSVIFFLLIIINMVVLGVVSFFIAAPLLGGVSLVLGLVSALVWLIHWSWHGVAIQETFSAIAVAIILILVARRFA